MKKENSSPVSRGHWQMQRSSLKGLWSNEELIEIQTYPQNNLGDFLFILLRLSFHTCKMELLLLTFEDNG